MTDRPLLDLDPQPVPYEDGNHCIFYAVQDASLFFNNKPLTIKDRESYQKQRNRIIHIGNVFLGDQ
jgi:hypothetical protein